MFDMSFGPGMEARITPALLNLVNLLSLPSLSLQELVQQELVENPALEEIEHAEGPDEADISPEMLEHLLSNLREDESNWEQNAYQSDEETDAFLFVAAPRSLSEGLLADLYASLPESEHDIALTLVGNLDDQGFLGDIPEDIAATLNVSLERVDHVLQKLRDVGPPGIATRDIQECLLAQLALLKQQDIINPYAQTLIEQFFDDLGEHRYPEIARQLGIKAQEVKTARDFIQEHLWPYPAQIGLTSTSDIERIRYRRPDVEIRNQDGTFIVEIARSPRRRLRLNPTYLELAKQATSLDDEEREHVQEYVARARTFLANLRQRETTLYRVTEVIVERQEAFLKHGVRHLVPMTRTEIAAELGLHESTVSRATTDKTALLPDHTLLPVSEFFVAARGVQDVMRELIEKEDKPLSDADLVTLLTEQGYAIARRTVAKYREQMQIPPSHQRARMR